MEEYISDNSLYIRSKNNSMINRKMIGCVLGMLLFIELGMFLLCAGVSAGYGESDYKYFLYTCIINAVVGGLLLLYGRGAENKMSRRDGYCVVTLSWVFFTFFGMLPFYFSGSIDTITNAFFETMSGFTTTGATILDDIESLSHGMLFWRSLTQWIGGLGIVFFTIAILPIFTTGGVQLFSAESTGVTHDRTHPKINVMAKWLWTIYLVLTVSETVLLMFGGMSLFDAICQSFATTATGGYSTKQNSISYWNSPYIEYVVAIFMIVSSINFSLFLMCLKGKVGRLFKDEELHWFLASVGILTFLITLALVFQNHYGVRFRQGYLQTHPCTVRVRTEGERGVLTIKGQTRGFSREEFEYEIPRGDADRMLDTLALPSLIDKIRYKIPYQGFVWEVDEFLGDNAGLVVAEIELSDEGQAFERPGWIGEEVTGDRRYANSALASRPFCMW